jgi:hypothetical protein
MWTYLRLLFSKNYWLLVRRRQFWRDSWVALRRLHKDKRARKQGRLLLTVLATPFFSLLFVAIVLASVGTLAIGQPGLGVGLIIGSVIGWIRTRNAKREDAVLRLFDPEKATEWTVSPELRRQIAEWTLVYAVLADRAGSEGFLAVKTLPKGIEVTTRRVHVNVLKQHGLWDRLGADEKTLLLLPDGHWEEGVAGRIQWLLEPLRVLRWTLRIDHYLPVVGSTLVQDFAIAKELVREPVKLLDGSEIITRANLEAARNASSHYFQRCAAEGVKRGYFEPESEANATWSREYSEKMAGLQSEDLLLGAKIVSEADEGAIRLATMLALKRLRICNWLIRVLSGEEEMGEAVRMIA